MHLKVKLPPLSIRVALVMIAILLFKRSFKRITRFFFNEFNDYQDEKSLLELGCGTGESFDMLSKKLCLKKFT